ncbi:MAG: hypothetical protein ACE37B_01125 [Ilumatobacter sp.]|jgi:hypothetical protein|uniref:hypothetical protein n=1 Tax=Ilumatobacter sp. TaxID=1967498 RepID=UPI00391AD792
MKATTTRAIALATVAAIAITACGSDDEPAAEPVDTEAAADEPVDTEAAADEPADEAAAVCPSNLVIQTDWFPELEHGGTYQLIGPGGTASKDTVSYSGPVQPQYAVGGLETIEIRTVNFDKSNASVLADGDADMAYITSSDIIKDSGAIPLVGIAKTLDQDPQMVMWDPTLHDIQSPEDIAATGAQVLHFPGTSYIDYMISAGQMTAEQSNPSYDGSDGAWVADGGTFFQQGFATNEIYKYENDIAWKDGAPADVSFYTVGELGFENYPAVITMLQSRAEELDECLQVLVPAMQQAWIDFLADPKPVTDRLITINEEHDGFWALSEGLNEAGMGLIESEGYALNSADGTYCSLDEDRLQTLYDILAPIYADQGTEIADGIDGIFTDKYCADAPGR